MNIFKRLYLAATLKEPEWWRQTLNVQPAKSGAVVTMDTALTVAAVWAAVRIIAEAIASLPIHVYERIDAGKKIAGKHPLNSLLSTLPNGENTNVELFEFVVSNLLLRGTSYCQKALSQRGRVGEIWPLYTKHMHVDRNASGKLVFDYQEPGNSKVYEPGDLWRTAGLGSNGVTGHSPILLGRESIGVALSAEEQASKLFANGFQNPVIFEKDGALSETAYYRIKKDIKEKSGSANAFQALLLEDGVTAKNIGFTAEDSQFLESRKFQIAEVARWFRVPLHMLNELDRSTNNNIEHQSIEFVMHTLRPWVKRLEASMLRDLFSPHERQQYFSEFNLAGLLRGDIKTRYEAYGKGINDGWLSRNEARSMENLNAVDGLDEFLVPLNMRGQNEPEQVENESQAIVEKEIRAVRAEYKRLDDKAFMDWVTDYYPRLADKLTEHGYSETATMSYCSAHAAALRARPLDVDQLLSHWQKHAAKDLYHG
ncbi:MAG: phage portal protein [Candidatus Thiodiazotropha endolucinida]